jgi:hypothetical protein
MAKNGNDDVVSVPRSEWEDMKAQLAVLLDHKRRADEQASRPSAILDDAYLAWKAEVSRPAAVRSQEKADRDYTGPRRYRVRIDTTRPDGKPGPNCSEHPTIEINANSPHEAEGRYRELCGIRGIDPLYRWQVEEVKVAA